MTRRRISRTLKGERGATAVEYSVFVFFIAAVIVLSVASLGSTTSSNLECTGKSWETQTAACKSAASGTSSPTSSPTSTPTSGNGNGSGGNGSGNGNAGGGNGNGQGNSRR